MVDSDYVQAAHFHNGNLSGHSKMLALRQGKVTTKTVGQWKHNTSNMTVRVYKKHYIELGMTEYWLKFKGCIVDVCNEKHLFDNYTRVDTLKVSCNE